MDDLHLSDFREMRLKSKVEIDIAYSAVMGNDFDAYLGETYSFLARGLEGREHDNTSTDHSLYSFPIKFGQNFQNFIGNFTVANKV